jgi:hypothetical protein
VLSLRLENAYLPRADVLWSLRLTQSQAEAVAAVTNATASRLRELPVVGVEIEGTTPSTKAMAADVANIAALGTLVGLLVVSEAGERGIYRRAARTIRTLRRSFGDLTVLPVEASWLDDLASRTWSSQLAPIPSPALRTPAGGETLEWSSSTRSYLRELGKRAGFIVAEPYVPDILAIAFESEQGRRASPLVHLYDPLARKSAHMSRTGDYLTASQVDLAWLLPLPSGLHDFLAELANLDPHLREHGMLYPELYRHICCRIRAGLERWKARCRRPSEPVRLLRDGYRREPHDRWGRSTRSDPCAL